MKHSQNDLGVKVILNMVENGVATFPRNFQIYYDAFSGNFPKLKEELLALGRQPSQSEIDDIGNRYFPERNGTSVVQRASAKVGRQMDDLRKIVAHQVEDLTDLAAVIETASEKFASVSGTGVELTILVNTVKDKRTSTLESAERLDVHSAALAATQKELNQWKNAAYTDALTQLKNRRAFDDIVNTIYDKPDYESYALILFDLDHFKAVNDTHGHPYGDRILQMVAQTVTQNVRDSFIARYGGEEFAIVLKNVSRDNIETISNRVRAAVERMPIRSGEKQHKGVTVSVGSCMAFEAENANDLIRKADNALYHSKHNGRNRVTSWSEEILSPDQTTGGALKIYRK